VPAAPSPPAKPNPKKREPLASSSRDTPSKTDDLMPEHGAGKSGNDGLLPSR
jgi:hypothetical protein